MINITTKTRAKESLKMFNKLNSFMFEPILDMSLLHLYDLYQEVKNLLIKNAVITP